jgi:hypothetical protein
VQLAQREQRAQRARKAHPATAIQSGAAVLVPVAPEARVARVALAARVAPVAQRVSVAQVDMHKRYGRLVQRAHLFPVRSLQFRLTVVACSFHLQRPSVETTVSLVEMDQPVAQVAQVVRVAPAVKVGIQVGLVSGPKVTAIAQ